MEISRNIMKYDYVIVGSGFFGSICARELTDIGKKCLVIDKRDHVAGNCYTKEMEGVNVHMYGSHIFHTNNKEIWEYVNRFASFNNFVNRVKANCDGDVYSLPINLQTLQSLWGVSTPEEAKKKLEEVCERIENPKNAEEWLYANVGKEITNMFYRGYTEKHWMKPLKDLPISIYKRLPIRTNFDDNYYNHQYQGVPVGGYTKLFESLLKDIEVVLNVDFFDKKEYYESLAHKIIYTGPIDEFFEYKHGELEYKTVKIDFKTYDIDDYQGCAVFSHPQHNVEYTKSVEHKHFEANKLKNKTIVSYEYPIEWSKDKTPYYPLNDKENNKKYNKYKEDALRLDKYVFGGRLAEYKYYDMHQVVGSALSCVKGQSK